ncbi:hypothetical protein [Pseudescherichia vulneris]|uniref:hypothetical protein n=1 Tax=Pseudescherichia vulneris TaxID=566 RepID=UPI001EDFDF93|nr:hypothetical protein [Pseudescherichia vulneris]
MEINKLSINDFREDMGVMRGLNEDSESLKELKELYYNESVAVVRSILNGDSIIRIDDNCGVFVFKVNEDIKFQLTLTNRIKYLSIALQRYIRNERFEEILSNDCIYHVEANNGYQFSDVEEIVEHENFGKHFRHMLVTLVKEVAKIS